MRMVKLVIPFGGLVAILVGASLVLMCTEVSYQSSTIIKSFKLSSDQASISCVKYANGELSCKEVK